MYLNTDVWTLTLQPYSDVHDVLENNNSSCQWSTVTPFDKNTDEKISVSRHLLAKQELETYKRFLALFQASPLAIAALDHDINILMVSPAAERMFGYSESELVGHPPPMLRGDREEEFRALWNRVLEGEILAGIEVKFYTRNSIPLDISIFSGPIRDSHGDITGIMAIFEDITERKHAVEELQASEVRYRTLVERMNEGLLYADNDDIIQFANNQFLRMLAYTRTEIIGKVAADLFFLGIDHDMRRIKSARVRASMANRYEIQMRTKANEWIWVEVSEIPVYGASGKVIGSTGMYTNISERKRAEEELKKSYDLLRNLSARLQSVREEESTRIAREIHDELGQALTAVKIDLTALTRMLPKDQPTLTEKTKLMAALIDNALQTVHKIATELRPGMLDDLGLEAAIEWQVNEFQNRTGIRCTLALPSEQLSLNTDCSTAIFRIFQETLTNIVRHAHATAVTISLEADGRLVTLSVQDNGKGISQDELSSTKSLGLLGMKERASILGGILNISGQLEQGTTVILQMPLEKPTEDS